MVVILFDKVARSRLTVDCVNACHKRLVVLNGRRQWAYVCVLAYWTKTYPCSKYDLLSLTVSGV